MGLVRELLLKYRQIMMYGFFGVLSTLVNILSYAFFVNVVEMNFLVSNAIAWGLAVLFAYVTNKLWVFGRKGLSLKKTFFEFVFFLACRIATGIMDMILMYLFVSAWIINDILSKVIVNFLVIILNYLLSKFYIFKSNL